MAWQSSPATLECERAVSCLWFPIATQGCGGVCAQAGCHHREQSVLQGGLQAGEHQPPQQVGPPLSCVCVCYLMLLFHSISDTSSFFHCLTTFDCIPIAPNIFFHVMFLNCVQV